MQPRIKNALVLFIKIFISGILLFIFFSKVSSIDLYNTFLSISIYSFILALCFFLLANILYAYKWYLLLFRNYSFINIIKLNFISLYYSLVLPGQIAGDLVKVYKLGKGTQQKKEIAISVLIDRLTGLLGLFLIGGVGVLISASDVAKKSYIFILSFIVIFSLIIYLLSFDSIYQLIIRFLDLLASKIKWIQKFSSTILELINQYRSYLKNHKLFFYAILLGAIYQILAVLMIIVIARELQIDISLWDWLWIFTLISIILLLPISIGGLGVREGGFIGVLYLFNISYEKSLVLSLLMFSIQIIGAAIGGLLELYNTIKGKHNP